MKRLSTLAAMGLLFAITSQASAQLPGDVGTLECGDIQSDAQTAVSSGGPYKNHGKLVSTAAQVVSPAEEGGQITAECSSCIMNQFARKIPIKDQEACGPDLCKCRVARDGAMWFVPVVVAHSQPLPLHKRVARPVWQIQIAPSGHSLGVVPVN